MIGSNELSLPNVVLSMAFWGRTGPFDWPRTGLGTEYTLTMVFLYHHFLHAWSFLVGHGVATVDIR